jgi:hypothetical protein
VGGRLRILVALLSIAIAAACLFEGTKNTAASDPVSVARPF